VICAWRHSVRGRLAAESGHDVVMAPMQFLYFDWLSSDEVDEPVALLRDRRSRPGEGYRFSVIPPGLDESIGITCEGRKYNSGASTSPRASTWTTWPFRARPLSPRSSGGTRSPSIRFVPPRAPRAATGGDGVHFRPLDR